MYIKTGPQIRIIDTFLVFGEKDTVPSRIELVSKWGKVDVHLIV